MKKSILLALPLLAIFSCSDYTTKPERAEKQRIIGKQSVTHNGQTFHLIEIDSVEYIALRGGGICPLVKK